MPAPVVASRRPAPLPRAVVETNDPQVIKNLLVELQLEIRDKAAELASLGEIEKRQEEALAAEKARHDSQGTDAQLQALKEEYDSLGQREKELFERLRRKREQEAANAERQKRARARAQRIVEGADSGSSKPAAAKRAERAPRDIATNPEGEVEIPEFTVTLEEVEAFLRSSADVTEERLQEDTARLDRMVQEKKMLIEGYSEAKQSVEASLRSDMATVSKKIAKLTADQEKVSKDIEKQLRWMQLLSLKLRQAKRAEAQREAADAGAAAPVAASGVAGATGAAGAHAPPVASPTAAKAGKAGNAAQQAATPQGKRVAPAQKGSVQKAQAGAAATPTATKTPGKAPARTPGKQAAASASSAAAPAAKDGRQKGSAPGPARAKPAPSQ